MNHDPEKVDAVARDLVQNFNGGAIDPAEREQIAALSSGVHERTVDEIVQTVSAWDISAYEQAKDARFADEKFSENEFSKVVMNIYFLSGFTDE